MFISDGKVPLAVGVLVALAAYILILKVTGEADKGAAGGLGILAMLLTWAGRALWPSKPSPDSKHPGPP